MHLNFKIMIYSCKTAYFSHFYIVSALGLTHMILLCEGYILWGDRGSTIIFPQKRNDDSMKKQNGRLGIYCLLGEFRFDLFCRRSFLVSTRFFQKYMTQQIRNVVCKTWPPLVVRGLHWSPTITVKQHPMSTSAKVSNNIMLC